MGSFDDHILKLMSNGYYKLAQEFEVSDGCYIILCQYSSVHIFSSVKYFYRYTAKIKYKYNKDFPFI